MLNLDHIKGDLSSIKNIEKRIVLVCQFGIITEGAIIEQNLNNTYSLLGGVQAWNEFQEKNIDLSRWSRQTVLEEIGISGQQKILDAKIAIVGMGGLGCPCSKIISRRWSGKFEYY